MQHRFLALWPSFPHDRILYRDRELIIVDKPVNVSTHAPDGARTDDAHSRVRQMIAELERLPLDAVYLGIHQRLDRDTSGVLLFTTHKAANAAIAAQFESHTVRKTYLAAVSHWPVGREEGVLRDWLVPSASGSRMEVWHEAQSHGASGAAAAPTARSRPSSQKRRPARPDRLRSRPPKGALEAITHFRVLTRLGDRTLLEMTPQTGRTHQIRVQLADRGAPIAGDPWYGGPPAPRLLLHARSLDLRHPITARPLLAQAPVPAEFEEWLSATPAPAPSSPAPGSRAAAASASRAASASPALPAASRAASAAASRAAAASASPSRLDRILAAAIDARWGLAHAASETTAFRLFHGDGEGLPGCAVDRYGEYLLLHISDEAVAKREPELIATLGELGPRGVYCKRHPKQSNTLVDPRNEEVAPAHAVWGDDAPDPIPVAEAGLQYLARLGDGLKTGIFLDQRDNRKRIRDLAAGKSVLNLFAYTCAFTVAAAAGGATSSLSVDVSAAALEWGGRNLAANGLESEAHAFIAEDVFAWLPRAARSGQRFDLIVLDPPSYATTHSSRFVADGDYPELAARALSLLAPGGRLLACTNHRRISPQKFRRFLHDAVRLANSELVQLRDLPAPSDFPPPFGTPSHLKSALVTLA